MAISRASLRALPFAHRVEFSRPVARVCLSATIAFLSGDLVLAGEVIAILVLGLSPDVTVTKLAAAGIIVTAIGTAGGVLALLLDAQDQSGTWTQQDTLDNPLDPANANRYAYAGDDPTNNNDPAGLKCAAGADAAAKIIGGIGIAATLTTLVAAGLASAPETGGVSVAATVAGISSVIGASGDITGGLLTLLC